MSHDQGWNSSQQAGQVADPKGPNGQRCDAHGHRFLSGPPVGDHALLDLAPGVMLGDRFHIHRRLSEGSHGAVFLAADLFRRLDVALKVASPDPDGQSIDHRQLERELAANGKIVDHRHVIRIHDLHTASWQGRELVFLSMEHAPGGTLHEWLRTGAAACAGGSQQALDFFIQVCQAVQACHDVGLLHRDLHADNIVLASDHTIRLIDFGHAIQLGYASGRECTPEDDIDALVRILELTAWYAVRQPHGSPADDRDHAVSDNRFWDTASTRDPLAEAAARCFRAHANARYGAVDDMLRDLLPKSEPTLSEATSAHTCVDSMWYSACEAIQEGELSEAIMLCTRILQMVPNHDSARAMLDQLQQRYEHAERLYREVADGCSRDGLEGLIELVRNASEIFPNHPAGGPAQMKMLSIAQRSRRLIEEGERALSRGERRAAAACLRRSYAIDPGATWIIPLVDQLSPGSA